MVRSRAGGSIISIALIALFVTQPGCGHKLQRVIAPNQVPTVEIGTPHVVESGPTGRTYQLNWHADDPDGRVIAYACALDPVSRDRVDANWQRVTTTERTITIDRSVVGGDGIHWFAVRAIDDRGAMSAPVSIALAADNIPPTVEITCPRPIRTTLTLPPFMTIRWRGNDPDGVFTTQPVAYKYLLLSATSEFPIDVALVNPDSLRNYYANDPIEPWRGWTSTSAETTYASFTNLNPGQHYLFVVIAFDEQGAYSPLFSLDTNMLYMAIAPAEVLGPRITMTLPGFIYAYPGGGYSTAPAAHIPVEVSSEQPVTVSWSAEPGVGSCGLAYRWMLDGDVYDETPRTDEVTDVRHWSAPSASVVSATLGPLPAPSPPKRTLHTLYIEATDLGLGLKSLGVLDLVVVPPAFAKDLLFVNDTRFTPDQFRADGSLIDPAGTWPAAAELDTFLFARGGVPWRSYPPGTLSEPGLFAGYDFDTVGTRALQTGFVPLSTLSQYRHVVWFVDRQGATFNNSPTSPLNPTTALRRMSSPGQRVELGAYVAMGGHLWLAGGGAACANLIAYNVTSNDAAGRTVFSSIFPAPGRELGAGRLMYDAALWQSEISSYTSALAVCSRFTGRLEGTGAYPTLPAALSNKAVGTDPLPPLRTSAAFYRTTRSMEIISKPNVLSDFITPSPLDTLMRASFTGFPDVPVSMTMTPPGSGQFVFSGFDFWSWQRAQCVELVDFVLHDVWGLTRQPSAASASIANRRPKRR